MIVLVSYPRRTAEGLAVICRTGQRSLVLRPEGFVLTYDHHGAAHPVADATNAAGDLRDLPVDPDVDEPESPPLRRPASRWPRIAPRVVFAVFVGGVLGGLARYGIGFAASPATNTFPWDIFAINLSGAFALAVLLVLVLEVMPPTQYLRPGLGTGFLGAFTTFSSLATATDQLLAHGHPGLAAAYAVGSLIGGLAAASFGLVCGRAVSANRHRIGSAVRGSQ